MPGYCSLECYQFEIQPDLFVMHCGVCMGDVHKFECKCSPDPSGQMVEVSAKEDWILKKQEFDNELEALVRGANSRKSLRVEEKEESGIAPMPMPELKLPKLTLPERRHDQFIRHHDDEIVDEVQMRTVPRFKTSGMSGDEWRTSVTTLLLRKGQVVAERSYPSMQAACEHLAWFKRTWREDSTENDDAVWAEVLRVEDRTCHQPGCDERSSVVYELLKQYDLRTGAVLVGHANEADVIRKLRSFCAIHAERGDCGLEDADVNYIDVSDDFVLQ